MASDLISGLKLQHIQSTYIGLESDQTSQFCIFMGDMNYRMNTRYQDFNNDNVRTDAINMISTHDQLTLTLKEGNYPNYQEAPISFLPSYKLAKE